MMIALFGIMLAFAGFSCVMITAIAWCHFPFALSDFLDDLKELACSAKFTRVSMKGKP